MTTCRTNASTCSASLRAFCTISAPSETANEVTAVDCKNRSGHVAGRVRRQQQQWTVQVLKATKPPLWYAPRHRLAGFAVPEGAIELRVEISGRQCVDPNAEARQLKGQDLRRLNDSG